MKGSKLTLVLSAHDQNLSRHDLNANTGECKELKEVVVHGKKDSISHQDNNLVNSGTLPNAKNELETNREPFPEAETPRTLR